MTISRKDQIEFAKEILAALDTIKDVEAIDHLRKMAGLLTGWVGEDNGVAIVLSEYMYEVAAIARGEEDTGWKAEFKKTLDREMSVE